MESGSKKETSLIIELSKIFEGLEKVRNGEAGPETPVTVRQGDHFSVVVGTSAKVS